jgi:predicted RNA-binding Zn-ribbon protein involved in translation (DUF1610 family)
VDRAKNEVEATIMEYPNARKYIKNLDSLDRETKETYEFEASLCETVIKAMGSHECPKCGRRVFKVGNNIVDFTVPFVSGFRIRPRDLSFTLRERRDSVECVNCGLVKKVRQL